MFKWVAEAFSIPKASIVEVRYEDFAKGDLKVITEIIRQGEARLQAQLQTALACDTRSVGLASLQSAASAALIIAAAQDDISGSSEVACYLSAIILLSGAVVAGWALRSVGFAFVGNRPKFWVACIGNGDKLAECLAGTAVHMDKHLALNDEIMKRHGRLTNMSLACLALAPLAALSALCFAHVFSG